jgi:hypothetical protein
MATEASNYNAALPQQFMLHFSTSAGACSILHRILNTKPTGAAVFGATTQPCMGFADGSVLRFRLRQTTDNVWVIQARPYTLKW